MELLFLIIILSYLLGSIPSAVWVGKYFKGIDIREHGSKNAGATNTFRVLGKRYGWLVLLVDVAKGSIASCLPYFFASCWFAGYKDEFLILQLTAAFFAVFGHVFPVFAQFRGGKGVATSLGVIIGINPPAAAVCLAIFLLVFISSGYVSLGSITAALCFPLVSYYFVHDDTRIMIVFTIVLGVSVIWAHRTNIERLRNKTENRMNLFEKKS
jgi:glycerol-3-phosphate acyltransferase PlsY